ncbi:hypothetical protein NDK25_25190 [Niallia taxi]|nr:hypothetical protein [Niallia taxi]MDE5055516.1 hypothetical protein [Niallia taxi]
MINTLKADIFRIIKGSLCVYSLLGLMILGILFSLLGSNNSTATEMVQSGLSNSALLLPIFLTNILMVAWGHEYSYRVVNNALIAGMQRSTFFLTKTFLTFLLVIVFIATYVITLMIATLIIKGGFPILPSLKIVLIQIPLYLAGSSIGILLFNVIHVPYVSVAAFISIALIGDSIISNIVSTYFPNLDYVLDTLLFSNLRNLVDLSVVSSEYLWTALSSGVIYAVVALLISFNTFSKREFK